MVEHNGKTALVTGANRGIGKAISYALAKQGFFVILGGRTLKDVKKLEKDWTNEGLHVHGVILDVTNNGSISMVKMALMQNDIKVDILINNAGIFLEKKLPFSQSSEQAMIDSFQTNTMGAYRLSKEFLPDMLANNYGRIINLVPGIIKETASIHVAYKVSKMALMTLTAMMADEYKDANIKINSACPMWCRTDMGGPRATYSAEEGANSLLWLINTDEHSPTGKFFINGQEKPF